MIRSKRQASALLALLLALSLLSGCMVSAPVGAVSPTAAPAVTQGPGLVLLTPTPEPTETPDPEPTEDGETPAPPTEAPTTPTPTPKPTPVPIDEDGAYTSRDDVALYLHVYGHLPSNFISKRDAQAMGWQSGSLDPYAYGMCIGGDRFGNYEGLLPSASGRTWRECDIDTLHARSRGAKRIVWSNDGLIYYTGDHYESFTLLYGEA